MIRILYLNLLLTLSLNAHASQLGDPDKVTSETNKQYLSDDRNVTSQHPEPSTFASFVMENYLSEGQVKTLIEFGAGDGKDSYFFASNGIKVEATDNLKKIIKENKKCYDHDNLQFRVLDINNTKELYSLPPYDAYYAQSFLGSSPQDMRERFIHWLSSIKPNAKVFLEFKIEKEKLSSSSVLLSDTAKMVSHFSNIESLEDVKRNIVDKGFSIIYEQETEDLSIVEEERPTLARLIVEKIELPLHLRVKYQVAKDSNEVVSYVPHTFDPDLPKYHYKMVHDFQDVMDSLGIPVLFTYGTLLGAIRHRGMIPWDDDADCFVYKENSEDLILKAKPILEDRGYIISQFNTPWWVGYKMQTKDNDWSHKSFLDIFILEKEDSGRRFVKSEKNKFICSQSLETIRVKYGLKTITIPKEWKQLLDSAYGIDWPFMAKKYSHVVQAGSKSAQPLHPYELYPAGPFE